MYSDIEKKQQRQKYSIKKHNKSLKPTKIILFGNCQIAILKKYFYFCLDVPEKFEIEDFSNNSRTGNLKSKEEILSAIKTADILIYQPLGKHHQELSEDNIKSIVSPKSLLVSIPYIFNSGVYSLIHAPLSRVSAYGTIYGEEIIKNLLNKYDIDKVLDLYKQGKIDFQLKDRFNYCIDELSKRETSTDIQISNFIIEHFKKRKLFLTHNHPTTFIFVEICRQLKNILGLPLNLNILDVDKENWANLGQTTTPISPYDIEIHGYQFKPNNNWLAQGSELISTIANSTKKIMMNESDKQKVANRWSVHGTNSVSFLKSVIWLGNPEVQARLNRKLTKGKNVYWPTYCVRKFLEDRIPVAKMASFGCGTGNLERHLARLNSFKNCDAFDIAHKCIETAIAEADKAKLSNIKYILTDIEKKKFEENIYDVAWFNGSLHHIQQLEVVCRNIARTLKPDGYLFFYEYIGSNRFNFSERQKAVIKAAFEIIPNIYRRSFIPNYPHDYLMAAQIPDPVKVEAADPSEAVRSEDIIPIVSQYFEIVEKNDGGGTVLQYLLNGIAGNFNHDDPESLKVLELLFNLEDTLVEIGDLESSFVMVAAKPRKEKVS